MIIAAVALVVFGADPTPAEIPVQDRSYMADPDWQELIDERKQEWVKSEKRRLNENWRRIVKARQEKKRSEVKPSKPSTSTKPKTTSPSSKEPTSSSSNTGHSHNPKIKSGHRDDTLRWSRLVHKYFKHRHVNRALCVISYESGGNPEARNPRSSARGLFQHLKRYWPARASAAGFPGAHWSNPEAQIAASAHLVYNGGGWRHWTVRGKCR